MVLPSSQDITTGRKKEKLPRILCQSWSHNPSFKLLSSHLTTLVEVMKQYRDYLKHNEAMKVAQSSIEVVCQVEENVLMEVRPSILQCDQSYSEILAKLSSLPLYELVIVN